RLYELLFEYPDFREMYLRRLRTVMDDLLLPPRPLPDQQLIEKRVNQLMDLVDPKEFHPSDAQRDTAAWPSWGDPHSAREESDRIIREYLPGRRKFLFQNPNATLHGEPIPAHQPGDARIEIDSVEGSVPAAEQYLGLTNRNNFAMDISGWRVSGA